MTTKNSNPKHELRWKAVFTSENRTFITYTQFVSNHDAFFEDALPDHFINCLGEVYFSIPALNEYVRIKGRIQPAGQQIIFDENDSLKLHQFLKAS